MSSLSVSIVSYAPNLEQLSQTITSLVQSSHKAFGEQVTEKFMLYVVDNGPGNGWSGKLEATCTHACGSGYSWEVIQSGANLGYGRAHNLAIFKSQSTYHLILNPDVLVSEEAITNAIQYMDVSKGVACLSPQVYGSCGEREYLCKRFPTVFDLFLRGFAPIYIRKKFSTRLDRYEMRGETESEIVANILIASGCFMFFRTELLRRIGGFSSKYFMYFEDFDLSLRTLRHASISYVPHVKITHYGGHTRKKGLRHIGMFLRSSLTFFNDHGWKWY